jgi:hypothetical protein
LNTKLTVLAFAFLAAGCLPTEVSLTPPYVAPMNGSVATIRFKNQSAKNLRLALFMKGCADRKDVGVVAPNRELEVRVPADQELTFQYYLTTAGFSSGRELYCRENLRFTPASNGIYIFRTTDESDQCEWSMVDTAGNRPVWLTAIGWKPGFLESSSFCDEQTAEPGRNTSPLLYK